MSKPFTYWVRLALVATMCTLVTFSPVSAGRLMDRLLHRDNCKPAKSASKDCWEPAVCESSCFAIPTAPCQAPTACDAAPVCSPAPACGCDAMVPAVASEAAVVEQPTSDMATAPVVQETSPAPVVTQPAPAVTPPATIVEQKAPAVTQPAPALEQPAPALEQPAVVVEQPKVEPPAPVVVQPTIQPAAPVVPDSVPEKPAVLEEPALAPGQSAQTAPNPFDAAPAKTPELDIFSEKPAVPATKEPELDVFGDAAPAVKAPDVAVEPAVIEKPAVQPEMPPEAPVKSELDDLFGTPDAKPAAPETKPAEKVEDIFGADTDAKPAAPVESNAPVPAAPAPAKTLESELEDLFNDKTVKPVADSVRNEPVGKPVTTEVESAQELPVETKASGADEERLLESLFGSSATLPPLAEPAVSAVSLPEAVESEAAKPEPEAAKPEPEAAKPEPEAAKPVVDELDALFGVSAFTPPSNFQGAEYRLWVDNSGAYQVKARLAVIYSDRVKLLKENGKYSTVPLSRLSEADFGYVSWVASNLTTDQTARMVKTKSDSVEPAVER